MRFVCDSCRAQYMISDEKVGAKGVKVRCKKCGYVILVRKAQDVQAAPAPPPPPPPEDGADATQVMQNPLAGSGDPDVTNPGISNAPTGQNSVLAGVADDEIGAVFDQVLQSGTHKIPAGGHDDATEQNPALGDSPDDRMSTRVLDAEVIKKLADEAAGEDGSQKKNGVHANGANGAAKAEPQKHDWFVAIDDKQVGPLKLEAVKERWDQGEIGPDSLCWRAGFSDWVALSEVTELAAALSPQPKKPVIVASAQVEPSAGAVVTVPVESAFSAGGVTHTVRSEVPVVTAAPQAGEEAGWKPSAASALASLVKEEIEALAKPQVQAKKAPEAAPEKEKKVQGILDIPSAENPVAELPQVARSAPSAAAHAPPVLAPAHAAPQPYGPTPYATSIYRAPVDKGGNRMMILIGAAVVVLLLLLTGVVVYLVVRDDGPAPVAQPGSTLPPTAVAQSPTPAPAPAAAAPKEEEKKAETPDPRAEEKKAEEKKDEKKAETKRDRDPPKRDDPPRRVRERDRDPPRVARADPPSRREEPEPRREEPEPDPGSDSDDFAAIFGVDKSKPKRETREESSRGSKSTVYIPPAPGQADIPEKLGTSDIMQVVVANKPAIVRCVNEQKSRDPGTSGRLVMRWTIRTSGRTSNVSVRSPEFKSTYVASCIGRLIKGWKFPRHKTQGDPVDFPFTF